MRYCTLSSDILTQPMGASAGPKRARGDVDRVPQGILKLRFGSILRRVVFIQKWNEHSVAL